MSGRQRVLRFLIALAPAIPAAARADSPMFTDDTWRFASEGRLAVDGGLAVGFPTALPTGLARGVSAGVSWGRGLAIGARVSATTATESSAAWLVTQRDLGFRLTGALQHFAGRGMVGLRVGAGGTLVHESRVRHQGMRAGLAGDDLETTGVAVMPVANLDAVVGVYIRGPWRMQLSGGPAVVLDGGARGAWSAQIGVAWQP